MSDQTLIVQDVSVINRGSTNTDIFDVARRAVSLISVYDNSGIYVPYDPVTQLGDYELAIATVKAVVSSTIIWHGTHQPSAGTSYTIIYNLKPDYIIKGTNFVKEAVIRVLRVAFSKQIFTPDYIWNENEIESKLGIYSSFPKRTIKNPVITVMVSGGSNSKSFVNPNEMLKKIFDSNGLPIGYRAYGIMSMTVNVEIRSPNVLDVTKLVDLVGLFFRNMFTFSFYRYGIAYKDINFTGESSEIWQGQLQHTMSITIPCMTEYQVFYPLATTDTINAIDIVLSDAATGVTLNETTVPSPDNS